MPRVTKRDKELGKAKPKTKHVAPGKKRSSASGPPGAGKKTGFKVGPSHASRDAYLGKAKKIKDDLIKRAKAKQSYAKVLKEEGMASNRLSAPGEKGKGRERVGLVKDPYAAFKSTDSDDDDSDEEDEVEKGEEAELMVAGRKRALSVSPPPRTVEAAATKDEPKRFKGKGKEIPNDRSRVRPTPTDKGKSKVPASTSRPTAARSATVKPDESAVEVKRSMRDLKKEAFSKRYPVNGGSRQAASADGRRPRGQPNMGARMGVLLEQIKRGGK